MIEHATIPYGQNLTVDFYFDDCDHITSLIVMSETINNVCRYLPKPMGKQLKDKAWAEAERYLKHRRLAQVGDE